MLTDRAPSDDTEGTSRGPNRRELLKGAAIVAAVWAPPLVDSMSTAAGADPRSPLLARSCGKMTGGGVNPGVGDITRYGFELHCNPDEGPNNLEVAFRHGGRELNFHLDSLTSVTCSDQPGLGPAPPAADFDTLVASGTGHLTGPGAACRTVDSATIMFRLVDGGEPGTADFVEFHIYCGGVALLDVQGTPSGGNRQAHRASGQRACR